VANEFQAAGTSVLRRTPRDAAAAQLGLTDPATITELAGVLCVCGTCTMVCLRFAHLRHTPLVAYAHTHTHAHAHSSSCS
jgi:hypothetical protein